MGVAYYVNQNGLPFVAQQTSFGNVNSANNNDGVTDGIANPLDNVSDDGSNGEAHTEPIQMVDPVSVVPLETSVEPVEQKLNEPEPDGLFSVDMTSETTPANESAPTDTFDNFDSLI